MRRYTGLGLDYDYQGLDKNMEYGYEYWFEGFRALGLLVIKSMFNP